VSLPIGDEEETDTPLNVVTAKQTSKNLEHFVIRGKQVKGRKVDKL